MNNWVFALLCISHVKFISTAEESSNLTEKEKCLSKEEKIFHEATGKCYNILTPGPCPKGEWLVLKKPTGLSNREEIEDTALCQKWKCEDGEVYWKETDSCLKPSKDQSRICGTSPEEELSYNPYGEGECLCKKEPPRSRLRGLKRNPCHVLYTRGPCARNQIFGYKTNESDTPECIRDPCAEEKKRRRRSGELSMDANLAQYYADGKCYELGTQGPCLETWTFKVHTIAKRPLCVSLVNKIYDSNCATDKNNICVQTFGKKGIRKWGWI